MPSTTASVTSSPTPGGAVGLPVTGPGAFVFVGVAVLAILAGVGLRRLGKARTAALEAGQ